MTWLAFIESNTTGTGRDFCATARARGLRPVLLTRDPSRYPYVAEDAVDVRVVDTGDLSAVVEACGALAEEGGAGGTRASGPDRAAVPGGSAGSGAPGGSPRDAALAGVASSSEYFVATAARVAAKLGLPAADGDAVARCRDKGAQRAALAEHGVPVPVFTVAESVDGAVRAAEETGFPVVLKPVSGSGSVGVRLCRDAGETRAWAGRLLDRGTDERGNPVPGRILVEQAVRGPEFSVETLDDRVVAVVAKHVGPEPYFVETGHDVPAPVPEETAAALANTALRALAALGLGWGAAHTELRLSVRGPVVIEVNPRLAGGMIPVAVRAATGVDLVDAVIARASGRPPARPATGAGHAAVRFLRTPGEGRIEAITGLPSARNAEGVVAAAVTTAVGRDVRVTHSFLDRLASVVATGRDTEEAGRRARDATGLIEVELDGGAEAAEAAGAAEATATAEATKATASARATGATKSAQAAQATAPTDTAHAATAMQPAQNVVRPAQNVVPPAQAPRAVAAVEGDR
ncbi:ATP-grasp domain-containing protein [Streptomyces lasiicapitis]|uniref:ATP-grasp domain-containing protein n=1 Tax=Streptomyces lasiicapitis TaxID=1923961 RepID=UPI0036758A77